ncbi:GTP cyclohydrolase I [Hyphomicrobium denitrificans ATCC 51888]|uniref:GTP cyclohydrolase 1 n=1 Tax=Hyphomicrobium denitrificans (strain ATCC 51888 / DSM 1869 / NCIMB 11706 / TK 0415) TaxID=582899 RepID=D8JYY7_HYPDA|nr:GTP cyclohydrolase I FolE [Hyphomicrobium denitrificans]ADJ23589.1 GTP cyclohydrolase I [Hyphomicrobium denitrificans ATCC 51888]
MKKLTLPTPVTALSPRRPSRAEAEEAVRTLIAWSGDNPARPGLEKTPERVAEAFGEYFKGYKQDALAELAQTFEDPSGYNEMVLLKDIAFESHCEHHIAPFFGSAHVAYLPSDRIVGLSKIARVVDIFARRLQTQESLTEQIATTLEEGLQARGVAIMMSARHHCMAARGVQQRDVATVTFRFLGEFERNSALRDRFMAVVRD